MSKIQMTFTYKSLFGGYAVKQVLFDSESDYDEYIRGAFNQYQVDQVEVVHINEQQQQQQQHEQQSHRCS